MALHTFPADEVAGGQELEYNPIQYRVEFYNGVDIGPVRTLVTWGNWCIESGFLIIHDENGLRHAHKIELEIENILTVEMPTQESYLEVTVEEKKEEVNDGERAVEDDVLESGQADDV